MSVTDWFGCPYDHCGFEGTVAEIDVHVALRHDPSSPKWDGYVAGGDPE